MKKLIYIIPLLFTMCQFPGSETEKVKMENDSLQRLVNQKDSAIYTVLNAFNDIEQNLQTIKAKEHIISNTSTGSEMTKSKEEQINEDINLIYDLMLENKNKVDELEQELKKAQVNSNDLRNTIRNLKIKLEEKNQEIIELRSQLLAMNIQVEELNVKLDTLIFDNQVKQAIIDSQDHSLNTAYYLIGTGKELKEQSILDKKGFYIGNKRLKQDFNKEVFNEIDIRKNTNILLGSKKVKIITSHPSNSYKLYGEKPVDSLVIVDPASFWSVSKYLVIVVN